MDTLLRQYAPLVRRLAKQLIARLPANIELDDLLQVGMIGLHEALLRFDDGQEVQFETFATQRIRGAMLDELRRNDWMSRGDRRRQRAIEAAVHRLEQRLGRAPTDGEMAAELGLGVREYQERLRVVRDSGFTPLEDLGEDYAAPDPAACLLAALEEAQRRTALAAALEALPEREQHVLASYYSGGETLAAIASRLGVTESRVSQVHAQAIDRLRRRLTASAWEQPAQREDVAPVLVYDSPVPDSIAEWGGVRWG